MPPITKAQPPQDQLHLPCPRCHSNHTKFCYYNNYNLSQPRYFCKSCRRYWTQGGALRNIPVGGGSRRNSRRTPAPATATSMAVAPLPPPPAAALGFGAMPNSFTSLLNSQGEEFDDGLIRGEGVWSSLMNFGSNINMWQLGNNDWTSVWPDATIPTTAPTSALLNVSIDKLY